MPAIIYWAIPGFLAFIGLELLMLRIRRSTHPEAIGYELRDTGASLTMGVGNLLIAAAWKTVGLAVLLACYEFRLFELDPGLWWYWALLIPAEDFVYYWFHRFSHRVRFAWAGHVNHHSSTHYNLSTALRQSWTSPFFHTGFLVPLALAGFHPLTIYLAHALNLLYQFWVHTEVVGRLPRWFEAVFNTPSHHRVHHGANPEYIDKNYAGILILWDRMFGSFEPEIAPVKYGLTKNLQSYNPLVIAFHEWSSMLRHVWRARRWTNKLLYLVMPPDWDPKDEPAEHFAAASNSPGG